MGAHTPSKYSPTVSLYKFQFRPTAALRALYIGSTSIRGAIGVVDLTAFCDSDEDGGSSLEDMVGVVEPPGTVSKLRRVVMVVDAIQ
jgi:hypothetical protein